MYQLLLMNLIPSLRAFFAKQSIKVFKKLDCRVAQSAPRNDGTRQFIKGSLVITAWVLFLAPNIALAIEDHPKDDQKTYLKSDSAKCSRQKDENICIYMGRVKLNQGTTSLQAEQIAIHRMPDGKINKIVASGKHSHYSGIMEDNERPINADADNIMIAPEQDTMTLLGNAQIIVDQDKSSNSQKPINALANKVIIYSKQGMMNLSGNVQAMMGQDKYSGPYIDYQFK